jgi:RNA polymerase sigma-70 factor (ECF subfamily)
VAWIPDAWLSPADVGADDEDEVRPRPVSAVRRDEAALAAMYAEHAPAVLRFLRDLLGDPAAAADATQETFVRAFRRLDTLRDGARVAPWIFGIARNVSLEHRRARRVRARVIEPDVKDDGAPPREGTDGRTPEAELLGREAAHVIERALGRLTDDRRALLLLRFDHGLSYDEIATTMGFSLAKVKVEIHRARAVLREELDAYQGDRA